MLGLIETFVGGRTHADGVHYSATGTGVPQVGGGLVWTVTFRRDDDEVATTAAPSRAHALAIWQAWIETGHLPESVRATAARGIA